MKNFTTAMHFEPAFGWALIATLFAAFISLTFSLQAGIFILIFTAIGWYAWKYPEEGFLLFLVLTPLLPMLKITQTLGTFSLVKDAIIIVLFARLFAIPLLTKTLPYRRNIVFAPIVLLAAWSAVATLQADSLILGVLRLRDIGLYMLLYFAVLYLPTHDQASQKRRLTWFAAGVLITLVLAAWQWFFAVDSAVLRFDPARSIWIPRISSTLAHPSIYGEYLVTALTLFGAVFLVIKNQKIKLISAVLAILTLPAIFLTYSRAVWIGTAAAGGMMVLVYLLQTWQARFAVASHSSTKLGGTAKQLRVVYLLSIAAAVITIGFALIRFTPAGGLLRSIFDPTYGSNEERVEFFVRLVAPLSNTEAIIGRGLGDVLAQNFREVDVTTLDIAEGDARAVQLTKNRTLVDNQYLKTFVEMGVIGIALYLWLYFRVGLTAVRQLLHDKNPLIQILSFWSVGFLAAFMIQALFIDIWDIFPTNALFWIVAALLSSQITAKPTQAES